MKKGAERACEPLNPFAGISDLNGAESKPEELLKSPINKFIPPLESPDFEEFAKFVKLGRK